MNRLFAAVTVTMCSITRKTDTLTRFDGSPLPINAHIQQATNHHYVLNHTGFMRCRFTQRPGASNIEKWSKQSCGSHGNSGVTIIACCWGSKVAVPSDSGGEINVENGTFSPVAIFHSVATVGLDSLRSICPNMALDTPFLLPDATDSIPADDVMSGAW